MRNKGNKPISIDIAKFFIKQIAECLKYLHSQTKTKTPVAHRDLKLENIIIDDRNNIKLIDFGFATFTLPGEKLKTFCGTPNYMAPEICTRKEYCGFSVDVWAFGVIIYVMLTGTFPFNGSNEKDLFSKISRGLYRVPEFMDFEAKQMVQKILVLNPEKRPKAADLNSERWLN